MPVKVSKGSIIALEKKPKSRCRKWLLQCYVNKKPKQKRFNGSYSEAIDALALWRAGFLSAADGAKKDAFLSDYFAEYLKSRLASGAIADSTYDRCVGRMNCFCFNLKGKTVREITPELVERNFALLRQGRSPSGKKLSGTYLNCIKQTASGMFDRAKRDGYADINPFDDAETPRPDTREKAAMTASQAVSFLSKLNYSEPTQTALMLCLTQGLRRSEAVNLKWSDVFGGKITVRKSKTDAGVRTMPITAQCANALLSVPVRGEFICSNPDGSQIDPHSVTRWLERNREKMGLPDVTPHILRHTFATLLAESGATPAAMQKLLGHASPVTSLRIYTHVHEQQLDGTVAALDDMLVQANCQRNMQAQTDVDGRCN